MCIGAPAEPQQVGTGALGGPWGERAPPTWTEASGQPRRRDRTRGDGRRQSELPPHGQRPVVSPAGATEQGATAAARASSPHMDRGQWSAPPARPNKGRRPPPERAPPTWTEASGQPRRRDRTRGDGRRQSELPPHGQRPVVSPAGATEQGATAA